jgi:hypothetical protein
VIDSGSKQALGGFHAGVLLEALERVYLGAILYKGK